MGFYFADVAEMGASFVAVADSDAALAQRAASWMATRAWERRQSFLPHLPDAATAVRQALQSGNKPVVLMDIGDNIGGGSPADSTILFSEVMRQGGRNAMVILCDPEAVRACAASGVGNRIALRVGAKSDGRHGTPVEIQGRVRSLSDGIFVERQVRHGGWGGGNQGLTAVVETDEQHTVVLTSLRMAPMSLEQVISLGIHPEQKDILIVKGVVAPRAAYEPIAGELILVDTPGVTSNNPANFNFRHRRHPLYPLEMDAEFPRRS
jgi:microcystin degradation protein MlrC